MLLLKTTNDLLRVVTDVTTDIEVHVSWMGHDAGTFTPDRDNIPSITTATTTTILTGPASGQYNVKHVNIRNNHASAATLVTVFHTDGADQEDLFECTLLAGEALVFTQGGLWLHYDANGGLYPLTGAFASQADMEAATSSILFVTPARQHFHPGHPKCWCKCGVTGNILGSYNMTSVTDTGAGRATFNIGVDFSTTNYCWQATVERTSTSLTVTNLKVCAIRNATPAAGSIEVEVWDGTATTAVQEDPTSYHVVGLGDQ